MPRVINVGKLAPGVTSPRVMNVPYANGQTYLQGSPVVLAAGVASECAANPTVIYGFTAEPAGSKAGYLAANNPVQVTGRAQETAVYPASGEQEFTSLLVNASAVPLAVTQAMVGVITYGLSKQTIGGVPTWVVDQAATACTSIVGVDIDGGFVYFKILVANRQVL